MEEEEFATRPYVYTERIEDIWGEKKILRKFICRLCEEIFHQHREFSRHIFVQHTCPICYK